MGYTHYWKTSEPFTAQQWEDLEQFARTAIRMLPKHSESAGGFYKKAPLVVAMGVAAKRHIRIDGSGRYEGLDLSHESFVFENAPTEFDFCKTARKPYDLMVCAVLIQARILLPRGVAISTDGVAEDWLPALEFHNRVAGRATPGVGKKAALSDIVEGW